MQANEANVIKSFRKIEQDFLLVHIIFTVLFVFVFILPVDIQHGIRMFILVAIYNIIIPVLGLFKKYKSWVSLWLFTFILSIFQVFPDWLLSAQLDVLVFPEDGLFKLGTVSGYMAGLWTIPLFLIIFIGQCVKERHSLSSAHITAGTTSFLIFGISEQTSWIFPLWYAENVIMIGHAAVYIIIPEIILGISSFYCYEIIKDKKHWVKVPAAFMVMQLYIGSAVFFYFIIENVLRH